MKKKKEKAAEQQNGRAVIPQTQASSRFLNHNKRRRFHQKENKMLVNKLFVSQWNRPVTRKRECDYFFFFSFWFSSYPNKRSKTKATFFNGEKKNNDTFVEEYNSKSKEKKNNKKETNKSLPMQINQTKHYSLKANKQTE